MRSSKQFLLILVEPYLTKFHIQKPGRMRHNCGALCNPWKLASLYGNNFDWQMSVPGRIWRTWLFCCEIGSPAEKRLPPSDSCRYV